MGIRLAVSSGVSVSVWLGSGVRVGEPITVGEGAGLGVTLEVGVCVAGAVDDGGCRVSVGLGVPAHPATITPARISPNRRSKKELRRRQGREETVPMASMLIKILSLLRAFVLRPAYGAGGVKRSKLLFTASLTHTLPEASTITPEASPKPV